MSEQKKKIILAMVLASVSIILLSGVSLSFFPAQQTPSASTPNAESAPIGGSTGVPAILVIPVDSTVELNSSEGFNSSIMAAGAASSPLFVLPPGGNGSVPFLVYSSGANETVNVSLSVYLGSAEAVSYGVQFSVSPSNFTLSPGEQVTSVLTIAAEEDAPAAFYLPTVEIQTNSSYIIGGSVNVPALLVANSTPSCLFLVNEQEFISPVVIVPSTPSVGVVNASASSPPPTTSTPIVNASIGSPTPAPSFPPGTSGLSVAPTINMVPGENATVIFGCLTHDSLSLNVTVPAGFSAEFSPNPMDIIFTYTSGNMYALTVTAGTNISSGTYEVNATGSLGSYLFDASFYVAVN
jgi:hypothetical protein